MFAIFSKTVAKLPRQTKLLGKLIVEEEPPVDETPSENSLAAMETAANLFLANYPDATVIRLPPHGILGTRPGENSFYAEENGVYLILRGQIAGEPNLILQTYTDHLIDRTEKMNKYAHNPLLGDEITLSTAVKAFGGEASWLEAVDNLQGNFSFILFDSHTNVFFATAKGEGNDCFFGFDSEDNIVFFDLHHLANQFCTKYHGAIPHGCYLATSRGLRRLNKPEEQLPRPDVPF